MERYSVSKKFFAKNFSPYRGACVYAKPERTDKSAKKRFLKTHSAAISREIISKNFVKKPPACAKERASEKRFEKSTRGLNLTATRAVKGSINKSNKTPALKQRRIERSASFFALRTPLLLPEVVLYSPISFSSRTRQIANQMKERRRVGVPSEST